MAFEFVTIGDPHLDNKLSKYIPNINTVVINEMRVVCNYARAEGVKYVVILGDLCDTPRFSEDALIQLMTLTAEFKDLRFIMYPGNHDTENAEVNSLNVIKAMLDTLAAEVPSNIRVITEPTVLKIGGERINVLPWPHFAVKKDCLNFVHVEINGAQWDHGKEVETERTTACTVISGHLHSNQIVGPKRNVYYPGTLYQKSFGERADKFFAHCLYEDGKLTYNLVPHKPKYTLHNIVISELSDFDRVIKSEFDLYKAYIKTDVILDPSTLQKYPNVVKHNSFRSRQELEMLMADELLMQDADATVSTLSVVQALEKWMIRASIEPELRERASARLDKLVKRSERIKAADIENKDML